MRLLNLQTLISRRISTRVPKSNMSPFGLQFAQYENVEKTFATQLSIAQS